jgi:hypothetical protein
MTALLELQAGEKALEMQARHILGHIHDIQLIRQAHHI